MIISISFHDFYFPAKILVDVHDGGNLKIFPTCVKILKLSLFALHSSVYTLKGCWQRLSLWEREIVPWYLNMRNNMKVIPTLMSHSHNSNFGTFRKGWHIWQGASSKLEWNISFESFKSNHGGEKFPSLLMISNALFLSKRVVTIGVFGRISCYVASDKENKQYLKDYRVEAWVQNLSRDLRKRIVSLAEAATTELIISSGLRGLLLPSCSKYSLSFFSRSTGFTFFVPPLLSFLQNVETCDLFITDRVATVNQRDLDDVFVFSLFCFVEIILSMVLGSLATSNLSFLRSNEEPGNSKTSSWVRVFWIVFRH